MLAKSSRTLLQCTYSADHVQVDCLNPSRDGLAATKDHVAHNLGDEVEDTQPRGLVIISYSVAVCGLRAELGILRRLFSDRGPRILGTGCLKPQPGCRHSLGIGIPNLIPPFLTALL